VRGRKTTGKKKITGKRGGEMKGTLGVSMEEKKILLGEG